MHDVTRPQWRDAIKDHPDLHANDVLVGLLIADYWQTDSADPFWAATEKLSAQSRLSRAAVFRAIKALRDGGFLRQVSAAKHNRSPRWEATLKVEQSHTETVQSQTETDSSHTDTRDLTETTRTPNIGSSDLDPESRARFPEKPRDFAERRDRQKLADHMIGYDEHVDLVYGFIRTGFSATGQPQTPMRWPGGYATEKHKLPTGEERISEWQGHFIRHFMRQDAVNPTPPRAKTDDPWATSA